MNRVIKMNEEKNCCQQNCYILGPTGPRGPAGLPGAKITVGSTKTSPPGTDATVSNSGTENNVILDFIIPRGDTGKAPTFQIGSVTTGKPGTDASVTLTPNDNDKIIKE